MSEIPVGTYVKLKYPPHPKGIISRYSEIRRCYYLKWDGNNAFSDEGGWFRECLIILSPLEQLARIAE